MNAAAQRQWMAHWRAAVRALEEQRRREIQSLSGERALFAAEAVLALASPAGLSLERRTQSGLVELQRLLHRRDPS